VDNIFDALWEKNSSTRKKMKTSINKLIEDLSGTLKVIAYARH